MDSTKQAFLFCKIRDKRVAAIFLSQRLIVLAVILVQIWGIHTFRLMNGYAESKPVQKVLHMHSLD